MKNVPVFLRREISHSICTMRNNNQERKCVFQGKILVGTKESEFIEINEKTGAAQMVTCGHGEGELWGLAVCPSVERFLTASDDGTVRMWDIVQKVGTEIISTFFCGQTDV